MSPTYLVPLKAILVDALLSTFNDAYPNPDFRKVKASIEFPVREQDYPSLWVDYDDTAPLTIAGINQLEHVLGPDGSAVSSFTRWKFSGYASITVVALSSLERDRLYDEVIRMIAFARYDPTVSTFRSVIEHNDEIACNANFDTIDVRGNSAAPGTPWQTDEIIYERSIQMEVWGEFTSDPQGDLVLLSAVEVFAAPEEVVGDAGVLAQGPYEAVTSNAVGQPVPTTDDDGWI